MISYIYIYIYSGRPRGLEQLLGKELELPARRRGRPGGLNNVIL